MEGMRMSNRSNIQELAKVLVEKDGLEQAAAENFMRWMFDIANEALQTDKQVKVRWLGTFKVLTVKDRESVDVNTGERILIEGRDKISFTPDNILKEIVNKPFAQFETVTVNEGVDFTEIDEKFAMIPELEVQNTLEAETEPETPAKEPLPESLVSQRPEPEPQSEPESVQETKEDAAEEVPVLSGELEDEDWKKKKGKVEANKEDVPESAIADYSSHRVAVPRYVAVVACFLILVLVIGMGWLAFNYGKMSAQRDYLAHQRDYLSAQLNTARKAARPSPKVPDVPSEEDSVQQELMKKAREDSARMAKVSKSVEPQPQQDKYDDDVRIRTGAYRIAGVAKTVKVKAGQTIGSISKAYLGPGMECYVEALNGVSKVTAGQEIKIPKLELKKKAKKQ